MRPVLQGSDLYTYQVKGIKHSLKYNESMLWVPLGRGKTIITLTVIGERMDRLQIYGTLVIATKNIIRTVWRKEAKQWLHTQGLTFSLVHGDPDTRYRALRVKADIYLTNYENLPWLADALEHLYLSKGRYLPFNMIAYDEVTKLKNSDKIRHEAIRRLLPYVPYRIGLTGEPASNGYKDLHGQYLAVDSGVRLGVRKSEFMEEFFSDDKEKAYNVVLKPGASEIIKSRIVDITYMIEEGDYKSFPPFVPNDLWLDLPSKIQKKYDELEKEMLLKLDEDVTIEVNNKAVLTNKCLQAANGALYTEPGQPEFALLHDVKLDALGDVIEGAGKEPIMVLYAFRHDLKRILRRFPQAEYFHGKLSEVEVIDLEERWNRGEIPLLLGHPASMGHGLNLQFGGHHIVWFGLNWSLELYKQANGRIRREGQEKPVILTRIVCRATLDEAVVEALELKSTTQEELKSTINSYRKQKAS